MMIHYRIEKMQNYPFFLVQQEKILYRKLFFALKFFLSIVSYFFIFASLKLADVFLNWLDFMLIIL